MKTQRYSVNQHLIETVLAWVKAGEIAIPEIQRPFVWNAAKVRDLMDSLYHGYPIGYLIAWHNPSVRLKDGTLASGKKILIDGQQRVASLTAAILGDHIVDKNYRKVWIKIAFHPLEEKFEVFNPAIAKDSSWLPDIAKVISGDIDLFDLVEKYLSRNQGTDRKFLFDRIEALKQITKKQIGFIELESDLDIELVTEIFIRINSQGVELSQADFAMSKIAVNEQYGGTILRKCIDYFAHLATAPEFYPQIENVDKEFTKTKFFPQLSWLKDEKDDLYDPKYTDLLRVSFMSEFNRGRLGDLVSLLSGRNFDTKTYEEEISEQSFSKLEKGIVKFINENNFKKFLMIIKSAGFISNKLVRSRNVLNFAYTLYLKLKSLNYHPGQIESLVRRWFVLSILTGRYSGSFETQFDFDIKSTSSSDFESFLERVQSAELSDAFWEAGLVQNLDSSVSSSPYFNVFLAAQVKKNDKGFLSKDIKVADLVSLKGDIHHVFPRHYLKKHKLGRREYNQIANYVYMQSEINIKVGNKAPKIYLNELVEQFDGGNLKYGSITDMKTLKRNLRMNCIPNNIFSMEVDDYKEFLKQRRILMAKKIRKYYYSL